MQRRPASRAGEAGAPAPPASSSSSTVATKIAAASPAREGGKAGAQARQSGRSWRYGPGRGSGVDREILSKAKRAGEVTLEFGFNSPATTEAWRPLEPGGGPETLEPRCEQPQALLTHKPWRLRRACISGSPRISEYPTQQQDSLPCARGGAAHDSACDATRLRGARCRSVRARAACAHCWGKRQPESLSRSRQASTW